MNEEKLPILKEQERENRPYRFVPRKYKDERYN